jgi:uncharacterized protein YjbI with pentapeptide repeats
MRAIRCHDQLWTTAPETIHDEDMSNLLGTGWGKKARVVAVGLTHKAGKAVTTVWRVVWPRRHRIAVLTTQGLAATVILAAISVLVLHGPVEWWLGGRALDGMEVKDRVAAVNSARQIALAAAAGTAALVGLGFTARTYYLSRRGQLTDRYTRAITQLASDKLTERLGGIYALEHLMAESPRDHNTVVEVLAAFVRDSALATNTELPPLDQEDPGPRPTTDVQAALTVLARRPVRPEPNRLNLSRTDLRGADLLQARLPRADLRGTQLQGADLGNAQLPRADLRGAHLAGAGLRRAQLTAADLRGAHLQGAKLAEAQLAGANLVEAQLPRADLRSAQLTGADLYKAQLPRADLRGAQLTNGDLRGAQLQGANLVGAQLTGADLRGAQVNASQLREVTLDDSTQLDLRLNKQLARPHTAQPAPTAPMSGHAPR